MMLATALFFMLPAVSARAQPVTEPGRGALLTEQDWDGDQTRNFAGTVVWALEKPAGSPADVTVHAAVQIPGRKMALCLVLGRNADKGLRATHTISLAFAVAPDFPGAGIATVGAIMMERSAQEPGVPLTGQYRKVSADRFLVSLFDTFEDVPHNKERLIEDERMTLVLVYGRTSRAMLSIEKGSAGQRAIEDAFAVWGRGGVPSRQDEAGCSAPPVSW